VLLETSDASLSQVIDDKRLAGLPLNCDDRIASFDLATGQQVFPGRDGYPRSLVNSDYRDFEPRIGLAWLADEESGSKTKHGDGCLHAPRVPG
jgi:hypothetical protein